MAMLQRGPGSAPTAQLPFDREAGEATGMSAGTRGAIDPRAPLGDPGRAGAERDARRAPPSTAVVLAGVLATAGVFGPPLLRGGWLLLLDWSTGPRQVFLPPSAYGLSGGVVAGLPLGLLVTGLVRLLGAAGSWVVPAAIIPLATWSASRLVGGSTPARLGAGLLYALSPFAFERATAGQFGILLAYALLPFFVSSLLRAPDATGARRYAPVLWLAVLVAAAPQFAWIGAVVVVAVLAVRHRVRDLPWLAGLGAGALVTNAYLIFPLFGHQLPVRAGPANLAAFATRADPHYGLVVNVLAGYGFWRVPLLSPKDEVSAWPLLLAVVLVLGVVGGVAALRDPDRRAKAAALLLAGAAGFLLALGTKGPLATPYRWAFAHLPLFAVMREPDKFAALVVLAEAVLAGWGIEALAGRRPGRAGLALGVSAALVLPLAIAPTFFDGLGGQVRASTYPAGWAAVERLMGTGEHQALFLPYELYLTFPFTHVVVANPAADYFSRPVISGDNLALPGLPTLATSARGAYLEHVFAEGASLQDFGALVAPLGVRFVVLAKAANWLSYLWLANQADLRLVVDNASLEVWRNEAAPLAPYRTTRPGGRPVAGGVRWTSPVEARVAAGPGSFVVLDTPYEPGWSAGNGPPVELANGTVAVPVRPGHAAVVEYRPWRVVEAGYALSGLGFAALALALALAVGLERRRGNRAMPVPGEQVP